MTAGGTLQPGYSNSREMFTTIICVLVAAVVVFCAGFMSGRNSLLSVALQAGSIDALPPTSNWGDKITVDGKNVNVTDFFASQLNEKDIKEYLSVLTASPHIAGSDKNRDLALVIYKEWEQYSFDSLEVVNYSVLLSYPNSTNPNSLTLRESSGHLIYESHIAKEPPLTPGEDDPTVAPPFNAYSGKRNVSGPLVYVNYGRMSDFDYLVNSTDLHLNLSSYICIVRYGEIFRGDKAHLAQRHGCKGLLIYSDPQDYAPEGVLVYPDGPSLPQYGVQRGSLAIPNGDLLTPGTPALPNVYRHPYSDAEAAEYVPRIPVQPISYGDAVHFMSQLNDFSPPDGWVGGLKVEYKILQTKQNTNFTQLVVNNYQEERVIYNVVAKLYGAIEPDRAVILGNHRDAWVFGAVDPNSGTAALMNVAKVIGHLRHYHAWRPGRTLTLCSWDAEEYGLIGSTEWVEDFGRLLDATTLAYLNVDVAVSGHQYFYAQANPLLYEVVWQAASMVKCPNESFHTLYDEWLSVKPGFYNGVAKPFIGNLGSGSDFTAFLQLHGISSVSMAYKSSAGYPVYHSVHDNYYWMSHFGDPSFSRHRATATAWINMALLLTTAPLPSLNMSYYAGAITGEATKINIEYHDQLKEHGISLDFMTTSALALGSAFGNFQDTLEKLKQSTDFSQHLDAVRIINDKMMNVERSFIRPEGLMGRPYYKHVIYAPSSINSYNGSIFPGFHDALTNAMHYGGSWEEVARQATILGTHFRYATQIVTDPSLQYILKKTL